MFASLGKMQLISNDLEATKLLNQQSLPLSSSLKFALSLCQAFRQSCLEPSSELQTHTHTQSTAFWRWVAVRSCTAKETQPFGLRSFAHTAPALRSAEEGQDMPARLLPEQLPQ